MTERERDIAEALREFTTTDVLRYVAGRFDEGSTAASALEEICRVVDGGEVPMEDQCCDNCKHEGARRYPCRVCDAEANDLWEPA